jgi:hypothetical protein
MKTINVYWNTVFILALLSLSACTTMQTTYFRVGYVELAKSDDPGLIPYSGVPKFTEIDDMHKQVQVMYNEGYTMLGYSQFVSPLLVSLAESYSKKYGKQLGAEYVVLETPRQGKSNLHSFLVTYWSRVKPGLFSFGGYFQNLPDDLVKRIGEDLNLVIVMGIVPGTPAAEAGVKANDVILAVDDVRVQKAEAFVKSVNEHQGDDIALSVSRKGKQVDLTVNLAKPVTPKGSTKVAYHEAPWLDTRPTDWSAFSIANLTASAIETQQELARQRQIEAQRQQQAADRYLNELQSEPSLQSGGRRGASRHRSISRRGGVNIPSRDQQLREYQNFVDNYRRSWNSPEARAARQRQQAVDIWFNNAPNIYGQLFQFQMPPPI